ncbi:MAG: 5-(carboxyamino)imidazole ribonucleotide synthase [Bacillota bacterium]
MNMNPRVCIAPPANIGIVGGGQLGRMMAQKAKKLGFTVTVLDPSPNSPAGQVADRQIVGSFSDAAKLRELVEQCEVTTYDLEHVDTRAMKDLAEEGHQIHPSPALLDLVQDKLVQKEALSRSGIPTPEFCRLDRPSAAAFERFGFPLVQKARRGGYDGKGVAVLRSKEDLPRALPGESLIERFIDVDKELAVMVARGRDGAVRCYPVVEMVFDTRANILDLLLAPARIPDHVALEAQALATRTVEVFDGVGVFGVEMFLSKTEKLFINEIAPRPHNSGHYTIEACVTCQFEQHLRAITGLPLGATDLMRPAAMINLLGEQDMAGRPIVEGLREAMSIPGVSVHVYGKWQTRPFRKMGHVTILDEDLEEARKKALRVKEILKIKAEVRA